MTRPESHREQYFDKRCCNCKFSFVVNCKDDLLCFHGDKIEVIGVGNVSVDVILGGRNVAYVEGYEYDKVCGGRSVHPDDICDCYEIDGQEASGDE